jgi:hypothetical protein
VLSKIPCVCHCRTACLTDRLQIKDLLELRQKQANVSEARAERHGAEESAHQGETIMLFTIVTVFFVSFIWNSCSDTMLIYSRHHYPS